MVLVAALLTSAAPLPAQTPSADALIERQRTELRSALRLDCPQSADENEVIVCGTREPDQRERLTPIAPPGRGPADRAGGEQRAAMAVGSETCTPVGRDQRCNGGLDMIGIGFTIARAIGQALANRD
jgi:hypothetical protein